MTLADFERLSRYWKSHPPVCDLLHALAVWAGAVKPPSSKSSAANQPSMAELKSLMGEK